MMFGAAEMDAEMQDAAEMGTQRVVAVASGGDSDMRPFSSNEEP